MFVKIKRGNYKNSSGNHLFSEPMEGQSKDYIYTPQYLSLRLKYANNLNVTQKPRIPIVFPIPGLFSIVYKSLQQMTSYMKCTNYIS